MVVIEPEEEIQPPKPAPASRLAADHSASSSAPPPPAVDLNGDDSDGFETASERGVGDEDEDEVEEEGPRNDAGVADDQHAREEAFGETVNDEERQQKVLEEANEWKVEGNKLFGEGKYEEALLKYDSALQVSEGVDSAGELHAICHCNRGVCFLKLGKYEDTVKECTKALELNPSYVKALVRRGEARERLENFDEAITDMKKILELDPSNEQAIKSIRRLEPLAAEKREKMKEEMIGKLKDMGNSLLGRFGMSVDNFKAIKDPNTGSYSISFQK